MTSGYGSGGTHQNWFPLAITPFCQLGATVINFQNTVCEDFELNYFRCLEAYGWRLGKRHCDLERRDYYECVHNDKKMMRADKIRKQRMYLFLRGQLDRPFVRGPSSDIAFGTWYDSNALAH